MAIVTVDFDGTLYQGNSFKVMFLAAKKEFTIKEWTIVFVGLIKAGITRIVKGKNAFRLQFFKSFAKSFKGKTEEELESFFKAIVDNGRDEIHHGLVQKINGHKRQGHTVILLSGALEPFLKAFIKEVNLDVHIISTELFVDGNGVCTGEVGTIINGEEKVKRVQQWIQSQSDGERKLEIWAYADSESDIPLLQFVEHPVVVNPNEDMKIIAEENKWPIFAG
ncbi:HAD family hydrolase [Evansella sp. AB-P1]|uniref:HAD family hydrolase n=1 Tax=Evansella sp. AB-P1 TaxID=3037653 RepID=UPI00241DD734|nr:HAD family hydrolase [Evansella sp. AB-P1]MDG5789839.1 HAD family hydrolase [Evansella sp. AB-P1]